MKPLLRAVLIVDALLLLTFGVLFLLTPWTSLYNALLLVQPQPAFVGQAFGVALVGLAWLALHASIDGAMTSAVARVAGHVEWLSGVLMLVWLIGLHTPPLTGFGQLVAGLAAVGLLVLGLGSVRLASAVRKRDKARVAESATAARSAKPTSQSQSATAASVSEPAFDAARYRVEPARVDPAVVEPARTEPTSAYRSTSVAPSPSASASDAPVSPATGHPVEPGLTATAGRNEMQDPPGAGAGPAATSESAAAGSTASTAASSSAARDEARREAAGAPRPPFHG
ncbi:hypothetical protein [Paraburkholderia kururiensis]|uniref:Transmembrane protein n=1 Tax=Paraburkholderia kururiensis TaxID=984307 RepID=A0ABZ0WRG0_9BURK|nr:hypothetical protein [Paraburkholderia kururiensis]WQD79849.1 hypothetical protein U0042_09315 [Paraburkholderia kururiensis]